MDANDKRKRNARRRNAPVTPPANRKRRNSPYPVDNRGVIDIRARAKRVSRKSKNTNTKRAHLIKQFALFVLPFILLIVVLVALFQFLTRKNAYEVFVSTSSIGYIQKNKDITEDYLSKTITAKLESEQGTKVQCSDTVTIKEVHVDKKRIVEEAYIILQAGKAMTYKIEAGVITVEGKDKIIVQSVKEANEILEQVKAVFLLNAQNLQDSGFVESVIVSSEFVSKDNIETKQKVLQTFQNSVSEEKVYTIVSGDNLSMIAQKTGMKMDDIIATNPGVTRNTILRVGNTLNVTVQVPYVSVYSVEKVSTEHVIPMPVEYKEDETKPFGYQGISQQGRDGKKEVSIFIKKINGLESERSDPTEVITEQPIKQIVIKGTKQ